MFSRFKLWREGEAWKAGDFEDVGRQLRKVLGNKTSTENRTKDPTLDFCMSTIGLADSKDQSASYQNRLRLDLFEFCLNLLYDFKGLSLWSDSCYFDLVWKAGLSTRKCWRKSMLKNLPRLLRAACFIRSRTWGIWRRRNQRKASRERQQASLLASVQVTIIDCRFLNRFSLVALLTRTRSMSETAHFQAFPTTWSTRFHLTACLPFLSQLQCRLFFSALQREQNTNQKRQESVYTSIHRRHHTHTHTKLHGLTVYRQSNRQCFIQSCNRMLLSHQAPSVLNLWTRVIKTEKIWKDSRY